VPPSQQRSFSESGKQEASFSSNDRTDAPTLRRTKTFDPEAALADVQSHRPLGPARSPPETGFFDYFPVFRIFAWMFSTCSRRLRRKSHKKKRKGPLAESNVPLEITIYLSAYLARA
jgi:hypothetical protein